MIHYIETKCQNEKNIEYVMSVVSFIIFSVDVELSAIESEGSISEIT